MPSHSILSNDISQMVMVNTDDYKSKEGMGYT